MALWGGKREGGGQKQRSDQIGASRLFAPNFMGVPIRLLTRPSFTRFFNPLFVRLYITRTMVLDASVPVHRGMMNLDKEAFRKVINVLAAEITPGITNTVLKAPPMRGCVLKYCLSEYTLTIWTES